MIRLNRDIEAHGVLEPLPKFEPGQLVRHKRYGYRGLVVDFDVVCGASDEWYQSNKTQPNRKQPWYHVLVHGTDSTTYAAEGNLLADESREPIDHPLVAHFFAEFENDRYVRNARPWPKA